MAEGGPWLDEDEPVDDGSRRRLKMGTQIVAGVVVVVAAVSVALIATNSTPKATADNSDHSVLVGKGSPEHRVLSALSATTDSGTFDFSYSLTGTAGSNPSSTAAPVGPTTTGSGVMDTSPVAMVTSADIDDPLHFQITVRVDSTELWQEDGDDNDLAPAPSESDVPGGSISGLGGITELILGRPEGAAAMLGIASPTGYLDLVQPAVSAVTESDTGTVDGVPVTEYTVTNDIDQLSSAPDVSSDEASAITAAISVLASQGFTSTTAVVSIDGAGYIREVRTTDAFSDGDSTTLDAKFSNFGCAGTVLMPGQSGSGKPPTHCASPDGSGSSHT